MSCQHQVADCGNIMAAKRESLLHRGPQTGPAVAGSELKQLDHLTCAMLTAVTHVQFMPQTVEGLRPASCLAPLGEGSRSGKCTWLALQHIQIMFQIEHLLLPAVAAFMASN